ncbi:MAG: hypothetical protein LBB74_08350 [Chitinispirillales bacterium]|jgi:hypothetical protein|nr:hypothetical protein [Chitinispirillales bacterium]
MRRYVAIILPLLILSAASFAQDAEDDASADSLSTASDFLSELTAAAEPEPPAPEPVAEDDTQKESAAESDIALKPVISDKTQEQQTVGRQKIFHYTAIGLNVLGAGLFAYGIFENSNVAKNAKEIGDRHIKNGPAADRAVTRRNVAYIAGSVFLASGITVHILF